MSMQVGDLIIVSLEAAKPPWYWRLGVTAGNTDNGTWWEEPTIVLNTYWPSVLTATGSILDAWRMGGPMGVADGRVSQLARRFG